MVESQPTVVVITTGGTIASRLDPSTGGVVPAVSGEDLVRAVPGLSDVARIEVRPFGRGPFRRFMLFGEPRFLFGKNLPQTLYTWSFDAIGIEHQWGAAIYLGKGFEMRVTQHFLFDRLGARDRNLGTADLGPNGPWGRYNAIGVRKYFGTRRW